MLKILGRRTSGNVMKPLWALDEIGIEYEQVDIGGPFGGNDRPEYRAQNPNGLVPTLVEDGFVMWESNAITRYLCAKFAMGVLCPEDPRERAEADKWMDWKLSTVARIMIPIFWGLVRTAPEDRNHDQITAAIEDSFPIWEILDKHLADRPYVAGDRLTMGDIPLGPQLHRWMMLVEDRPSMPHLEAWYQRLTERPAFKKNVMIPLQ
jgi:glutathione S-transferase